MESQIRTAIDDGYTTFIMGMAQGVDIWAAEIVIQLRTENPQLKLIAAVPFPEYTKRWTQEWKSRAEAVIAQADLGFLVSEHYSLEAYQKRNMWMVDHSGLVISVFNGEAGGTDNCIQYAMSAGVPVRNIPDRAPNEHYSQISRDTDFDEDHIPPYEMIDTLMDLTDEEIEINISAIQANGHRTR